jgi:hypothetical protein
MCNKGLKVSLKKGCPGAVYKGSYRFFKFPNKGKELLKKLQEEREKREINGRIRRGE